MAVIDLMLSIHVLNVGQGSSVVIEFESGSERHFGVIDSNVVGDEEPKALGKLKSLGAKRLSFLALTHPHTDHYRGLYQIILAYRNAIDHFYTCPFGDLFQHPDRLQSIKSKLLKIRTDGLETRRAVMEFGQILWWADTAAREEKLEWFECRGDNLSIAPPGFSDVQLSTILPPARVVGDYVQRILKEDMSLLNNSDDNDISLAFKFSYADKTVVLGGDGSAPNWIARQRYETNRREQIGADVVNLPHHGSRKDCSPEILNQLFSEGGRRIAVTSADGIKHPHFSVIEWLESNSIAPYCTNLIPACGANVQTLITLPNLDPQLSRWIREVADNLGHVQICQGDVMITIDSAGALTVVPQFANACGYRGDYSTLFGL